MQISRRDILKMAAAALLVGCNPRKVTSTLSSAVKTAAELVDPTSTPAVTTRVPNATSTATPIGALTPAATLALVNGTLVDGTGADPIADAVLIIGEERIVAVGPRASVTIPGDVQTIDVQGATVLPGFINTHVHQAYDTQNLKAWAQEGVTTVRDLGSRSPQFSFRDRVLEDPQCARLVAAGTMFTTPGGYGSLYVTSPDDARAKVNAHLDAGAELIKMGIEDDLQERTWPMLSLEEMKAIVETAHERGVPASAHISRARHLELALEAGVDDVAHMIVDPLPDDLVRRMIKDGMYWVPTLELWKCVRVLHGVSWDAQAIDNLRRFVEAGGKATLGTDYAGYRCEFDLGMPMTEIELMQEASMTPMQIIVAATQNAAHICGLADELGTLEVGKAADVLVVDGDPLADLETLSHVRMVLHKGVAIRS
jgi:imidazolonepropionase-like amidohydrolase